MSNKIIGKAYSLDDLLLVPKYSDIISRKDVNVSVDLGNGFNFNLPFVPSNMKTITEMDMVKTMYAHGSLSVFHRFADFATQLKWLSQISKWNDFEKFVGFSVGVKHEDYENVKMLISGGVRIICIDVAHGDSKYCYDMIKYVRQVAKSLTEQYVLIIAGNVTMGDGAKRIWEAGADICKVGVGQGSICTTRINTGNGIPTMTTLMDCYDAKLETIKKLKRHVYLMQDGGCKNSGDLVKALCFADIVMCGNIFAATDEAPGNIIEKNGKKYKSYVGSSTHRGNHKEGVEGLKLYKGPAYKIIEEMCEGIKSGCSYQGVSNLVNLKLNPQFVEITNAGIKESNAHDLDIIIK